jgi:hypothetical protein
LGTVQLVVSTIRRDPLPSHIHKIVDWGQNTLYYSIRSSKHSKFTTPLLRSVYLTDELNLIERFSIQELFDGSRMYGPEN